MAQSFLEREIHVYQCLSDPSRKHIAMINGFDMVFKGESGFAARKAANDWRREAVANDKLLTKKQKAELLGTSTHSQPTE